MVSENLQGFLDSPDVAIMPYKMESAILHLMKPEIFQ